MIYTIKTNKLSGTLFELVLSIYEGDLLILQGTTKVNVPFKIVTEEKTQEDIVQEYAENVFLKDLIANNDLEGIEVVADDTADTQEDGTNP